MLLSCLTMVALALEPPTAQPWASGPGPGPELGPVPATWHGAEPDTDAVVGGEKVPRGQWDDAVGIEFYNSYIGCTGTLIGPKVVLTAGHCVQGIWVTGVLVGSKDWSRDGGTRVGIDAIIEYPDSQQTFDVALLLLEERAPVEPREIAVECILRDYLEDGASAQIVGFGATTEQGTDLNTKLNQASTTIRDKNCDESLLDGIATGCRNAVKPRGELAAGGDGTDACFGDSGGPLYLETGRGDYLVGVTSRAFAGASFEYPCRDGGIWVRPDAVLDWIEEQVGGRALALPSCNEPPEIVVPEMIVGEGGSSTVVAVASDPDGDPMAITWSLIEAPEHGQVELGPQGQLTFTSDPGYLGDDRFVISATDGGNADWRRTGGPVTAELEIGVRVVEAGGLSCQHSSGAVGWVGLLPLLLGLRRRSLRPVLPQLG